LKDDTIRQLRTELLEKNHKIEALKARIKRLEEDMLEIVTAYKEGLKMQEGDQLSLIRTKAPRQQCNSVCRGTMNSSCKNRRREIRRRMALNNQAKYGT